MKDEGLEKKPQSKQNVSPVGFPPIPASMLWRVDKAPKQAETIPIGEEPKTTLDKRTNGKGGRSGRGNEHGIQKYATKILKKCPGLTSGKRVKKKQKTGSGEDLEEN